MSKGFTLLELIIVIGILAILGTVSVLVLNPAQLFAQARDTTRIQDLQTLNSALGLYVSSVSSPSLGTTANCYVSLDSGTAPAALCGGRHLGALTQVSAANLRTTGGSGWVPVNFGALSAGSPVASLPVDPTNSTTYFYSYAPDDTNKTFELNAKLESTRYRCGGTDDRERNDGGNKPATSATACNATQPSQDDVYEIGTDPGLNL